MKIALYGPMTVGLAAPLREILGGNVTLYLDDRTVALNHAFRDHAVVNDPTLCKVGPWASKGSLLSPSNSELAREFSRHDFGILSDLGPVFGAASEIPFSFWPAGMDLTITPFRGRSVMLSRPSISVWARRLFLAERQARGIQAARSVWCAPLPFFRDALNRLGVRSTPEYLPLPVDTSIFRPGLSKSDTGSVRERLEIFHPSRLLLAERRIDAATGNVKGNESLLSAVKMLQGEGAPITLNLVLQGSLQDRSRLKQLVRGHGIESVVNWLEPASSGFTWNEMAHFYSRFDFTAVDFASGWFGNVALESAACAKPVMIHLGDYLPPNPEYHPPFLLAETPEEIAEQAQAMRNRTLRDRLGAQGREWALRYHSPLVVAERAINLIRDLK